MPEQKKIGEVVGVGFVENVDASPVACMEEPAAPLRQAVKTLVMAKARADRLAQGGLVDREIAARCGLPAGEDGTAFFRTVFPFCGCWDPLGTAVLRKVPLALTVGHSWRWHPDNVAHGDRASLRERFLSCTDGIECAEVCWIVPLGLYLAHEGKNRIEFLRSEGATHYPALTTPYDYPAAERLSLIQVPGPHNDEWWAVLDQDSIEPLRYPEWSLPILTAYGVTSAKEWPADYPPYAVVRQEFNNRRRHFGHLKESPVSLKALNAKEDKAAELVCASLIDLPGVRLRRGWKRAFAALVAAVVVAIPAAQPPLRALSLLWACFGAALMLLLVVFARILAVPRRQLDSQDK